LELTVCTEIGALDFISKGYLSALIELVLTSMKFLATIQKLNDRLITWSGANNLKGFITEMDATAMLSLAKDWGVERELTAWF